MVALVGSDLRIRFSTSHPKDMTDDVIHIMNKYKNICNYIHLPVQSGSSKILKKMNRCLLYTSPSPRDKRQSRMPSSA